MSPRFARVRPDLSVDEALGYLRRQMREKLATSYYAYVLDHEQRLLGVVSLRELFSAEPGAPCATSCDGVHLRARGHGPGGGRARHRHRGPAAVPVLDAGGRMKGIVTVDDIVDVVQEEATEDIQKIGGQEASTRPTSDAAPTMIASARLARGLFVGEMLTATAMGYFEDEIAAASCSRCSSP
jgi:magnesium transporter